MEVQRHHGRDRFALVLGVACLFAGGCHQLKEPVSKLNVANPATANQLLSGFSWIESDQWRWTARTFSAALRPPETSETSGATLSLHLYVPDSQIQCLGPMTLTASVEGEELPPETFTQGGTYLYTREVPKRLLATSMLPVKFSFDKALPPETADGRELAAIVTEIELQAN